MLELIGPIVTILYITGVIWTFFLGLMVAIDADYGQRNIASRLITKHGNYRGYTIFWLGVLIAAPVWPFVILAKYIRGMVRGD